MIAQVCDRESRRDSWFENRLAYFLQKWSINPLLNVVVLKINAKFIDNPYYPTEMDLQSAHILFNRWVPTDNYIDNYIYHIHFH